MAEFLPVQVVTEFLQHRHDAAPRIPWTLGMNLGVCAQACGVGAYTLDMDFALLYFIKKS